MNITTSFAIIAIIGAVVSIAIIVDLISSWLKKRYSIPWWFVLILATSTYAQVPLSTNCAIVSLAKAPNSRFQYGDKREGLFFSIELKSDLRFLMDNKGNAPIFKGELEEPTLQYTKGDISFLLSGTRTPSKARLDRIIKWVETHIHNAPEGFRDRFPTDTTGYFIMTPSGKITLSDERYMFKAKVVQSLTDNLKLGLTFPAFGANTQAGNSWIVDLTYAEAFKVSKRLTMNFSTSIQSKTQSQVLQDLGYRTRSATVDAHLMFDFRVSRRFSLFFGGSFNQASTLGTDLPSDYNQFYLNFGFRLGQWFEIMGAQNPEYKIKWGYHGPLNGSSFKGAQKGVDVTARITFTRF